MSTRTRPGLIWAWAVLIVAAANQLLWNLWHAYESGMPRPLAIALGAMPVLLAIGTSALATRVQGGWIHRVLTYGVMLSAIGLSVLAQYDLLMQWTHSHMVAVLFPAVGDLAVLIALHTLIAVPRSDGSAVAVPSVDVPEQAPAGEPVRDAEPVPVRAGEPRVVPAGLAEPLERSVPGVPAEPVPAVAVQTGGTERPVPAARTVPAPAPVPAPQTTPDRAADPVPDQTGPPEQTTDVPALTSTKDGDDDALERMDRAFTDIDPAEVSIRQVRRELDGAGYARAKRLHGLWVARTAGSDRAGTETGTPVDGADQEAGTDDEAEPDRTADRVPVPA